MATFEDGYGPKPDFASFRLDSPSYRLDYQKALNWANAAFKPEEFKTFTIKWLTAQGDDTSEIELVDAFRFGPSGKVAWMLLEDAEITNDSWLYLADQLAILKEFARKKVEEKAINLKPKTLSPLVFSWIIQDRLEKMIDDDSLFITNDGYKLMSDGKSRSGLISSLKETFTAARDEFISARSPELEEYFVDVTDEDIALRVRGYTRILEDIDAIEHNRRATRKRHTARASKVVKAVKNVNYKVADLDLKITSIDPAQIVGAKALVTFNTKSRRVTLFVAKDGGLKVTGTTVKNFDDDKSMAKTLRKPAEHMPRFRDAPGIRRINVLMTHSIKGKIFSALGRLNSDTLLLKVMK